MGGLPDRFLRPPSIELLRSAIPVGDDLVHIANEDRVMRLVEEAGLLSQRRPGPLGLHGEKGCQGDRRETNQRVGDFGSWVGRRRKCVAHHRQTYTSGCDERDAARAQEASRHQDDH